MENTYKVYCHTNKTNNKKYIGLTRTSETHRWDNGNGYTHNRHFWGAIQKYGWDGFEHEILATGLSAEEASAMEQELIAKYNTMNQDYGYNLTSGGEQNYYVSDETRKLISDNRRVHGGTGTNLHKRFLTMRERDNYCEEWNDFVVFKEWALNNGYAEDKALCRIDDSIEYSPENCVWVGTDEQHDFRSDKVELEHNGETHNLKEWSKILDIPRGTLFTRYYKGWSAEDIICTPKKTKSDGLPKHIEKHGDSSYRVCFSKNGKRHKVGRIKTLEEAIKIRDELLQK